jgi:glucose-1-phosphate adenylyltransferase
MKTKAVILAGGEGSRLGTLTAKRTKPAVPFAGKYRIIDFTLSNCVNSGIFDDDLAQTNPHSLIDHIMPVVVDLDRDFTGACVHRHICRDRPLVPRTADAVQQNFHFRIEILNLLILQDHIYEMDYSRWSLSISVNRLTAMAVITVPVEEASRLVSWHDADMGNLLRRKARQSTFEPG